MDMLKDFHSKDFLEQIAIVGEIENKRLFEAVDSLFDLVAEPVSDPAVNTMIRNSLRTLLLENDTKALDGFLNGSPAVSRFCMEIVSEKKLPTAAPKLLELAGQANNPEDLLDILACMAKLGAPEFLPNFRANTNHNDPLIASLCLQALGQYKDTESLPLFIHIVSGNEADDAYEECGLPTWKAIEALGYLGAPPALAYLVEKIHHRNPTARRLVHETLIRVGAPVLEYLAPALEKGDLDTKIMTANVIGFIGDRKGADILLHAFDTGAADHPNVVFAMYEAMGRIRSMKGLVCLMDALTAVEDEVILGAVVTGLDGQVTQPVAGKVRDIVLETLTKGRKDTVERLMAAIVSSKAANLFAALYEEESLAGPLVQRVIHAGDPEASEAFRPKLLQLGTDRAKEDAARLPGEILGQARARLLAIDDSAAMLNFYRSLARSMDFDVTTAGNGKEAWEYLEGGEEFDIVVVDMNMPVMNGIEFTEKVRANPFLADLPIIMATTESERSQAKLAKKAGVTTFLTKPFTADVLRSKIDKLLES